jgi:hypothetical protein
MFDESIEDLNLNLESVVNTNNDETQEASEDGEKTTKKTRKPKKQNKKIIKRARKNKPYFTKLTQDSIQNYLSEEDDNKKNTIYNNEILPALEKLVENLINIHKFNNIDDNYNDIKNDCISFLYESLKKFDFSRGTNAFSYFNVLAKNWLIIKSKQKQTKTRKSVSIDSMESEASTTNDHKLFESNVIIYQEEIQREKDEKFDTIMSVLHSVKKMSKTKNEIACMDSIISIFENIDNIDFFNKNAVFLYLRELSGLNPKQLTLTIQNIKKYYKKSKEQAYEDY